MIWTAMMWGLCLLLVGLSVWLAAAVYGRNLARQAAQLPARMRILAADLGERLRSLGRGSGTLRDNEWGLVGKIDLLLTGPEGRVAVEVKRATGAARREAGRAYDSHVLQMGVYLLVCESDPRVGQQPVEGRIRYVDRAGRLIPGGEVIVPNTPALRERVLEVVRRMRTALQSAQELHRSHEVPGRCAKCSVRGACSEALA
jgi:CRISPR/Cas system-associated exonuclease Cas4 (RecB family)